MLIPLVLLALAAEATDATPRLPMVETIERIPLPRSSGTVTLTAYPFSRRIELRSTRDGVGLATKIAAAGRAFARARWWIATRSSSNVSRADSMAR